MQTKFLLKIKWYKTFLAFCVLVIQTLFINQVFAQEVTVTVNLQHPPYNQLKIEHLWNLTLTYTPQDTVQEILNVYLYATLTEVEAGQIATGTSTAFELPPGVKTFTAANYQELDPQIDYTSSDPKYEESVMRTGGLPSGDYEICIYVRLASNNENIGDDCIEQTIELMPAPSLISPDDGDILVNKNPVFTWMLAVTPGTDVFYKIKIVEIWGDYPAEIAMQNNPAWFEEDNIRTTVFQLPASAREFLDTITYVWQVTALSPSGEPIGENDGESEVWSFITGKKIIREECDKVKSDLAVAQAQVDSLQSYVKVLESHIDTVRSLYNEARRFVLVVSGQEPGRTDDEYSMAKAITQKNKSGGACPLCSGACGMADCDCFVYEPLPDMPVPMP